MKLLILVLLMTSLVFLGCSRDLSSQISMDEANQIAFQKAYPEATVMYDDVWQSSEQKLNGDYRVIFSNIAQDMCIILVDIKYDGSKVLNVKHSCFDY